MADFSFSFDSDNPFAEPEQTPKKANASTDETPVGTPPFDAPSDVAPPSDTPASDDDFSLDSFDFAFDEDASLNDALPTRNAPESEASPRQLTPGEAAFAEFDFTAPDGTESLTAQTPVTQTPEEIEAPIAEAPEFIAPEIESPEVESPETEASTAEMSETEALEFTASEFATPEFTTPEVDAPEFTTPEFATPEVEAPEFITPEFATPEVEAPEIEAPEVENFNGDTPEAESAPEDATLATSSARSDLEEFNAFTYDFESPADELSASEAGAEISVGDAATESASDEAPSDESLSDESLVAEFVVAETSGEELDAPRPIADNNATDEASVQISAGEEDESEGQTEAEFRRLKTKATLKVAVLGASGIGKNHARWFHRHGCQIVGFLGTSPDSTTRTEADLSADFDFQGNAYTDLEVLLQTEKPDIVCVATPPPLHFSHVLQSLEAGAHVLCEKPLVYAPTRKFRENRDGAKELVKVAAKRKLNLGTQLQYGGATPILCKLAGLTPTDVGDFAMELETTNPNSPRDARELWIDLGPHPISVAQMLAGPGAQLAEETIVFEPYQDDEKTEVLARFGINCADGRLLMVRAVVRALRGENPRKPRRRFSFNGHAVNYFPLQSAKNGFQAQFVAPDGYASVYPDPVDYLISNFVDSCRNGEAPLITGDFGRENLEWMLRVGMPGEAR